MAKTIQIDLIVDASGAVTGIRAAGQAVEGFNKQVITTQQQLQAIGTGMTTVGAGLTAAVTVPLVAAGGAALKFASDFDSAMTQSVAIMGDLSDAMKADMEETAREVAKETVFSAEEAAESYFFLASAGLDAAQSISSLPQVAAFAQAGMFDMAMATDLATDAQSALGLSVKDPAKNLENMTRVTDVLVKANTLANASVEQFSRALTTKAGPALKAVDKDIEEGVAVLAAFADQGIKAEVGGVNLSIVMRDLQTKSINNREEFERFGVEVFNSTGKMNNMADIIGMLEDSLAGMSDEQKKATLLQMGFADRSVASLMAVIGLSDKIRGYEADLRKAGGTTQEVADKQMASFSAQMGLVKDAFVDAGITLGKALMPIVLDFANNVLKPGAELIGRWAEAFAELPKPIQMTALAIAGLSGPALLIGGQLATVASSMLSVFTQLGGKAGIGGLATKLGGLAGPLAGAVTGTAALTAGAVVAGGVIGTQVGGALLDYGDKLRGLDDPIRNAVKEVGLFEGAASLAGDFFSALGRKAVEAGTWIFDSLGKIPGVAQAVEFAVASVKLQIEFLAVAASYAGDVINAFGEWLFKVEDGGSAAIAATASLAKASELTGRAITDEAEALQIVREHAASLRPELEGVAGANENAGKTADELAAEQLAAAEAAARQAAALEAAKEAAEKYAKAVSDLARSMGTQGLASEAAKMSDAMALLDKTGQKLTEQGLKRAFDMIEKLRAEGLQLPPALQEMADKTKAFGAEMLKLENLEKVLEPLPPITDEMTQASIEAASAFFEADEAAADMGGTIDQAMKLGNEQLGIGTGEAIDFGSAMMDLANIMTAFGVQADSALGVAVAGLQQLGTSLPAMRDFSKSILGNKDLSGAEKFQGVAGGLASGAASIAGATSSGGAAVSAAKGAMSGAAAGAQIGGPIGAGVGAAIGGLVGFFRGRGRDKLKKDIQDSVGATVSEELAKAIKEGAEKAGRSVGDQALLSLGDIISTEGFDAWENGVEGASEAALQAMAGIAAGTLPAQEGIASVGDAFSAMAAETFEAGKVADAALLNIVQASKGMAQEIPEVQAFIEDALVGAAAGVDSLIGGIQIMSVEDAQDQATILAGAFFATMEEVGLLEAVDAFQPAFEELQAQIAELGGGDVNLGGVGRLMEIAQQDEFRPLLEGVQGLNDAMVGLANSGYLTEESFAAFQRQGQAAFEQLTAAGLTEAEALQQMAPFLQSAIDAAERFGIPIDENTQRLIDQAEAAGIAFETDPMNVMVDALGLIAELLGATDEQLAGLGETAQQTGEAVNDAFSPENADLGAGIDGAKEKLDELPEAAQGAVDEIAGAFTEGSTQIAEGLGPISDKMETEIKQVGTDTATAIDTSFKATNKAIEEGLGSVAETFKGPVVAGADAAVAATDRLAKAAASAARAAASIEFPDIPGGLPGGGDGGGDRSNASGFSGLVRTKTRFTVHPNEYVTVVPAGPSNALRAEQTVSAQGGFGGISLTFGDFNFPITAPVEQAADGEERIGLTREELADQMTDIINNDFKGMVTDTIREQLFEGGGSGQ